MLRRNSVVILFLAALSVWLVVALVSVPATGTEKKPTYVGDNATKCKMCHPDQVKTWEKWDMAKAMDSLKGDMAKNEKCLKCHVTGWGAESGFKSMEKTPKLAGVQCEACHGPASLHMAAPITDKEKRRATVEKPTKDTCLACHNKEYFGFKEFDYDKALPKIKHWEEKE